MKLHVVEIGSMVEEFKEEMFFVLFGMQAPQELRDISVIHEYEKATDGIYFQEGSKIHINGVTYTVREVGNMANANFDELGHVAVYLKEEKILPGAIKMTPYVFPEIRVGDEIRLELQSAS